MEEQIERFEQQLQEKNRNATDPSSVKVHDVYQKPQFFSWITNDHLANLVILPPCVGIWFGGFIFANENKVSPIQSNFARYICQIVIQMVIMFLRRQSFTLKKQNDLKLLIIRGFISGGNGLAVALFQMFLPLTVYYTLSASSIIFTFLLNYLLFHTPLTSKQVKAIITAILGIILVVNGRFIYTLMDANYEFSSSFDYSSKSIFVILMFSLGVIVWNVVWAYGVVITGKHHSSINELILINSIVGLFLFGVLQMAMPQYGKSDINILLTRKPQIIFKTLFYTGLPIAIANYFFNTAMYISTNTGVSIMVTQLTIVYGYIFSLIRYGQQINLICLLGGILLLGSIYHVLFKK